MTHSKKDRLLFLGLLAVVVFMDQSGGFGAVNAAPVAQAIVKSYFHIKNAGPNGNGIRD